jgi:hypothetical protein
MKGWTVNKMHDHCAPCAELAASAVEHANKTGGVQATSSYTTVDDIRTVIHQAHVERTEK